MTRKRFGQTIADGLKEFLKAIKTRKPVKVTTLVRIPHAPKKYLRIREKKPLR